MDALTNPLGVMYQSLDIERTTSRLQLAIAVQLCDGPQGWKQSRMLCGHINCLTWRSGVQSFSLCFAKFRLKEGLCGTHFIPRLLPNDGIQGLKFFDSQCDMVRPKDVSCLKIYWMYLFLEIQLKLQQPETLNQQRKPTNHLQR